LLDRLKFANQVLELRDSELERLVDLAANDSESVSAFTQELRSCLGLMPHGKGTTRAEDFADCIGQRPLEQPGIALAVDRLLSFYSQAATLDARYTESDADKLFRLGRLLVVFVKDELSTQLDRSVVHP
jgi:hypothetical protein